MSSLRLTDICEFIVDCEHKTAPTAPDGIPSIRTPNVGRGRLILNGVNRVSPATYEAWTRRAKPQAGDLIIAREAPVGNVAMILPGQTVCLGQRTVLVRPSLTKVDPAFLTYFLLSDYAQSRFHAHSGGATVAHLNMRDIRGLPLPKLPILEDQKRIGLTLSSYDDLIEVNRCRMALLESMARELFEEWFVRLRFPGCEQARFVETEDGSLPTGWRRDTLGTLSANYDRLRVPLSGRERAARPGPYPYYGAAKLMDFVDGYIYSGTYLLFAEDGSVSTGDGYPVLQIVDGKFWVNNHAHVLQGKYPVSTEYLYIALSRYPVAGHITGAAQPKITQANLNRIKLLVADDELMRRFCQVSGAWMQGMLTLRRANDRLAAARDLLLPRLLSGRLTLRAAERELAEAA